MQARTLFDVVARLMGLWQVLQGIATAGPYLNASTKLWMPVSEAPNAMLVQSLAHLLPGLYLLFYASQLVGHLYGPLTAPTAEATTFAAAPVENAEAKP